METNERPLRDNCVRDGEGERPTTVIVRHRWQNRIREFAWTLEAFVIIRKGDKLESGIGRWSRLIGTDKWSLECATQIARDAPLETGPTGHTPKVHFSGSLAAIMQLPISCYCFPWFVTSLCLSITNPTNGHGHWVRTLVPAFRVSLSDRAPARQ